MSGVVSPVAGTRIEPKDSYIFIRGTTATIKIMFSSNGAPITVDTATSPQIKILVPIFLTPNTSGIPVVLDTISGSLVAGQQYEYQFVWNIPLNTIPSDEYLVSYYATIGGIYNNFADEFISITDSVGQIDVITPTYATVDEVRMMKFNIDSYLPNTLAKDLTARNNIIMFHLRAASNKLREELCLFAQKLMTPNHKLFTIHQAIYTILLASRGEDGSSVSDQNLIFWRTEADKILNQEKRKYSIGGTPLGRG